MPALLRETPNLVYLIAGQGDDRKGLQEKATSLDLSEHVVFAGMSVN
jgi:phosphatidylinositol alpha-1,6-mannosyltransferase